MAATERLQVETTCGVIVDVQERLYPHMADAEHLEERIVRLVNGLQILGVQLLATEQYPKGLGSTLAGVREAFENPPENAPSQSRRNEAHTAPGGGHTFEPIEKLCFSCTDSEVFAGKLRSVNRRNVILAGIEAHVCVQQTTLDLIAAGYGPVVVADCVSSRSRFDMEIALERLRAAGATVTTSEALLFELCRYAGTETFKRISKLVK